jgi:hypothetical protein
VTEAPDRCAQDFDLHIAGLGAAALACEDEYLVANLYEFLGFVAVPLPSAQPVLLRLYEALVSLIDAAESCELRLCEYKLELRISQRFDGGLISRRKPSSRNAATRSGALTTE